MNDDLYSPANRKQRKMVMCVHQTNKQPKISEKESPNKRNEQQLYTHTHLRRKKKLFVLFKRMCNGIQNQRRT